MTMFSLWNCTRMHTNASWIRSLIILRLGAHESRLDWTKHNVTVQSLRDWVACINMSNTMPLVALHGKPSAPPPHQFWVRKSGASQASFDMDELWENCLFSNCHEWVGPTQAISKMRALHGAIATCDPSSGRWACSQLAMPTRALPGLPRWHQHANTSRSSSLGIHSLDCACARGTYRTSATVGTLQTNCT